MPSARSSGGTKMPRSAELTICSPKRISPASGFSKPATHLRSVVLPEPLRPRRTKNSFSSTCKSTPSTAWTLSAPVLNALLSEWMLITADLRSCRKNSLHESPCIRHKNLPFPSFPKRGWRFTEKFTPLKRGDRGDRGGFDCYCSCCHRRMHFRDTTLRYRSG